LEKKRYFTLEEANNQIPWLAERVRRIAEVTGDLARLRRELDAIVRQSRGNGHSGVDQKLAAKRRETEVIVDRLSQLTHEVDELGIILRDLDRGLVDFPSLRDGLEVYLCWLAGEERIDFWHEVNTGFAGRQPL
jgi:hypothetical protein